jgi:hypothetical protein
MAVSDWYLAASLCCTASMPSRGSLSVDLCLASKVSSEWRNDAKDVLGVTSITFSYMTGQVRMANCPGTEPYSGVQAGMGVEDA